MDEVLNELLNEALMTVETIIQKSDLTARMNGLEEVLKTGSAEDLRRNEHLLAPCQRVADDPKYRAIFQDPTLAEYVNPLDLPAGTGRDERLSHRPLRYRTGPGG